MGTKNAPTHQHSENHKKSWVERSWQFVLKVWHSGWHTGLEWRPGKPNSSIVPAWPLVWIHCKISQMKISREITFHPLFNFPIVHWIKMASQVHHCPTFHWPLYWIGMATDPQQALDISPCVVCALNPILVWCAESQQRLKTGLICSDCSHSYWQLPDQNKLTFSLNHSNRYVTAPKFSLPPFD